MGQKEKAKETEDDWEKVSVPSVAGDNKELKPAPPPPVNFWTARKQAQEAKLRDMANQRTVAASQSAPPSAAAPSKSFLEGSKRSGPKDPSDKEGQTGPKRSTEPGGGNGEWLSVSP